MTITFPLVPLDSLTTNLALLTIIFWASWSCL